MGGSRGVPKSIFRALLGGLQLVSAIFISY
jgi:hypothetical protein